MQPARASWISLARVCETTDSWGQQVLCTRELQGCCSKRSLQSPHRWLHSEPVGAAVFRGYGSGCAPYPGQGEENSRIMMRVNFPYHAVAVSACLPAWVARKCSRAQVLVSAFKVELKLGSPVDCRARKWMASCTKDERLHAFAASEIR